jgi:hypothetical protein
MSEEHPTTYEAGVILTVRVDADNIDQARDLMLQALEDCEEICAKQNVHFEWELQDVNED